MQSLKTKNLILVGLVFALALVSAPAKSYAYPNAGFYELSYSAPIAETPAKQRTAARVEKKTTNSKTSTDCNNTNENAVTKSAGGGNSRGSNLAASAASANSSFVPHTLVGWLALFVMILFAVILFRKLWIIEAEKKAPLKHA